ncbi:C6 zinc finger domain protein [Aspergillus campestris IBT 28561]|uniref:C6 zinc finger domain protein n=1 Tax=Aspergillus campestris (strain IBT 28561) TaxID=1392248 RepID=A0A2I1CVP7_ASPC2|nr:C6 zinc finger domain protein [Aspergillus campestris IBT 28561]PKY01702.1 C6 zinc finger domain protein [Aspergillus campestris IBT 28561]
MAGQGGPRKRRRPAQSCEQCRHRKVRCDRNIPCGPCTRARSSPHCSYRDRSPSLSSSAIGIIATPDTPHRQPLVTGAFERRASSHMTPTELGDTNLQPGVELSLGQIQHRLQLLEDRLAALAKNPSLTRDNQWLEKALHDLTEKTQNIEQQLAVAPQLAHTQLTGDNGDLSISNIPPRLHASAIDFKDLKADLTNVVKDCRALRKSIKSRQSVTLNEPVADLHSTIPPKLVCDELVQCYLRTFGSMYRVLHMPSFWKSYRQFWTEPKFPPVSFLMKLVLVLAIGTAFYSNSTGRVNNQFTHLKQKWVYAAQWWFTGPSEKTTASLDGLQVFCLLLTARKISGLGTSHVLSTSSLIEMAMRLGLHIDPSNFPALSALESEMRVRLWATILELALQSSLELGLPCNLPLGFDTRPPLNINDQDIGPGKPTIALPSMPSNEWTDTSVLLLLHESVKPRMGIVQFVASPGRKSYQQALQFTADMRLACRELASAAQTFEASKASQGLGLTDFHKKFLDIELHRYIVALHAPFTVQARKDPRFYYSRKASLESAMVIASYANDLCLPSGPLDDFSNLILVGSGSFKGPLALDIISALGLELVTQLEEESSPQSLFSGSENELAKATRAPVVRILEHILDQLLQIISLGSPNLKRYNFLAAILAQLRAMQSNQCVKRVVYETVTHGIQECYGMLQSMMAGIPQTPTAEVPIGMAAPAAPGLPDPTSTQFGFHLVDPIFDIDLDLASLLCLEGIDDPSSSYL